MELKIFTVDNLEKKLQILSDNRSLFDIDDEDLMPVFIDENLDDIICRGLKLKRIDSLSNDEMENILLIYKSLDFDISLGYGKEEKAVKLTDLHVFVKELRKNNIELKNLTYTWFLEDWTDKIRLMLWNTQTKQVLFF